MLIEILVQCVKISANVNTGLPEMESILILDHHECQKNCQCSIRAIFRSNFNFLYRLCLLCLLLGLLLYVITYAF
jgi:hypothetical protein